MKLKFQLGKDFESIRKEQSEHGCSNSSSVFGTTNQPPDCNIVVHLWQVKVTTPPASKRANGILCNVLPNSLHL